MVRFARNASENSRLAARNACIAGWTLVLAQASGLAVAQTTPPPKTDSDIKTPYLDNYTPSEEVKRRAMGPLRIIKQMGDQKKTTTPAPSPAPAAAAAPAPAPVAPPKPKVEETAKAEKKVPAAETQAAPAPTPAPAPAATATAAPAPTPAPAAAPVTPPPEPAKVAKQPNLDLIPIRQDSPIYNRNMMREMTQAVVRVAFNVNPDGHTSDIEVTYSRNSRLNKPATDAVAKWLFKPIDEPVRAEIELMFVID